MDRTGSGFCSMTDFGFSGVEFLGSVVTEVVIILDFNSPLDEFKVAIGQQQPIICKSTELF
jgi:hypothetical protein